MKASLSWHEKITWNRFLSYSHCANWGGAHKARCMFGQVVKKDDPRGKALYLQSLRQVPMVKSHCRDNVVCKQLIWEQSGKGILGDTTRYLWGCDSRWCPLDFLFQSPLAESLSIQLKTWGGSGSKDELMQPRPIVVRFPNQFALVLYFQGQVGWGNWLDL